MITWDTEDSLKTFTITPLIANSEKEGIEGIDCRGLLVGKKLQYLLFHITIFDFDEESIVSSICKRGNCFSISPLTIVSFLIDSTVVEKRRARYRTAATSCLKASRVREKVLCKDEVADRSVERELVIVPLLIKDDGFQGEMQERLAESLLIVSLSLLVLLLPEKFERCKDSVGLCSIKAWAQNRIKDSKDFEKS